MTKRWFKDQFDERMRDEANERSEALRKITALCSERSPELGMELGIPDSQMDKLLIENIKEIINEL